MDGDLFENVPCVDSNISYTDKKEKICVFKFIRILVDEASKSRSIELMNSYQ